MEQSRFPYRIEKTKNRHSRAVLKNDTIVIRLARNLSQREERRHVEDLLRRMKSHLLIDRKKTHIDPFRPILDGTSMHTIELESGDTYTFSLVPSKRAGKRKTVDGWEIRVSPSMKQAALHRSLWNTLSKERLTQMEKLVKEVNERTLKVRVKNVRLRIAVSQWGSCSSRGIIAMNTALLFVPQQLLEYVIIHELAHIKYPHHSSRFWGLVAQECPFYEAARKELKGYRLPTLS